MEVFISWSGLRSKHIAESFKSWLGLVIQSVEPWISPDIEKGARWNEKLSEQLEKSSFGIICLTKDNLNSSWILFEAGALSKKRVDHVCTFLYDLKPIDIEYPLAQFQHTENCKEEIFKLVTTINKTLEETSSKPLKDSILKESFESHWSKLEAELRKSPELESKKEVVKRKQEDILLEILETVRNQQNIINSIKEQVLPEYDPWKKVQRDTWTQIIADHASGLLSSEVASLMPILTSAYRRGTELKLDESANRKKSNDKSKDK